ncbi:MAG TPA: ABC transporter permease [Acidobacteriaceae bacterium]|jgi:ABC-2 type transport system permease protein|nr:ABC transporter permease [Acidobacteriaceae bacterium]
MGAIYIMWLREVKRYFRSRAQIIVSLGQPTLYLLALGFGFGPVFKRAGAGNYIQFMAPGVIAMIVLFSSIFSGMAMLWDRQFGFLKETLVAPVPRLHIILGRTLGGATVAMMQGVMMLIVCLIAGFRPVHAHAPGTPAVQNWAALLVAPVFVIMIAIVFAALGASIGSTIKDMQGFQMLMNFLVMPLFFLSGALYPLQNLGPVMTWVTHADPLAYGVDGLRGVLIGNWQFSFGWEFSFLLDFGLLALLAAIFLGTSAWLFSRVEV